MKRRFNVNDANKNAVYVKIFLGKKVSVKSNLKSVFFFIHECGC